MKLDREELVRIVNEMDVHKVADVLETTCKNLKTADSDELVQAKMLARTLRQYFSDVYYVFEVELSQRLESSEVKDS